MKRCPSCNRTYSDISLNFCLEDGTPLLSGALSADPHATIRDVPARHTSEAPPTEVYRQEEPLLNQVAGMAHPKPSSPQWSPTPARHPQKKSNVIWWVLGGIAVFAVIGIGLIIMLLALASIGGNENAGNLNTNSGVIRNKNANINSAGESNTNSNANANLSSLLPSSLTEDFSSQKWTTGNFQFGDIWYADDEYHMRAKENAYLVMYAPSGDYNTENAIVRVTARSVSGTSPTSGYGLIVHGQKSNNNQLEDYALLIYTGNEPQYEVVMHKAGSQKTLVPWTRSNVLRSGTSPNQLEIRSKGDELSFFINGRYLSRIRDKENFKRGVAGLYTSETDEVVFDDLEIERKP